jgi:hypothetical protein
MFLIMLSPRAARLTSLIRLLQVSTRPKEEGKSEDLLLGTFRSRVQLVPYLCLCELERRHQDGSEYPLFVQVFSSVCEEDLGQLVDEIGICVSLAKCLGNGFCGGVLLK